MNQKRDVFERIAGIYALFFNRQRNTYSRIIRDRREILGPPEKTAVLDAGCGTSSGSGFIIFWGYRTSGRDRSLKMMKPALKQGLDCSRGDLKAGLDLPDKSFDLVMASFVAHGFRSEDRRLLYSETRRLARDRVIFHDYGGSLPGPLTMIIEILELFTGGDFFGFRRNGQKEMKAVFSSVRVERINRHTCWYICGV